MSLLQSDMEHIREGLLYPTLVRVFNGNALINKEKIMFTFIIKSSYHSDSRKNISFKKLVLTEIILPQ